MQFPVSLLTVTLLGATTTIHATIMLAAIMVIVATMGMAKSILKVGTIH